MNHRAAVSCLKCATSRPDTRLKPAHDGGITRVHCPTCKDTTEHKVTVMPENHRMNHCKLTSFATYRDLVSFCDCVEQGGTFNHCLSHGDNGRGASGHVTAQQHTPMVALSRATIVGKWGSLHNGWGKKVWVTAPNGKRASGELADFCSEDGICDCNPAMLVSLGYSPDEELSVPGQWEWA
jgi:hypothetical protein